MLLFQGALNLVGGLMAVGMWQQFRGPALELAWVALIASGAVSIFVASRRKSALSDDAASLILGANLLPVYCVLWLVHQKLATQTRYWIPFQTHELSCLTIAILAPPRRAIGAVAILLFPLLAVLQYAGFTPEQIGWLPARSLHAPLAFGVFALVLYFFRLRALALAEYAAARNADAQAMRELTRTILAVKDLANSPIQTLTFDVEILRRKHPETSAIADRVESCILQLRELNRVLDERLREKTEHPADPSFDAYTQLKGPVR